MTRIGTWLLIAILALVLVACGRDGQPAEETAGPEPTGIASRPGATAGATAEVTIIQSAPATEVATAVPTASPESRATETPLATPSATPTPSSTLTPPPTPEPTTPSATPTPSPTVTPPPAPDSATIRLELEPVAGGLDNPVGIADPGDDSGRLFVLEQPGRIRIVDGDELLEVPFLDIVEQVTSLGNEQGLLGLAFHPQYAANGRFFINYTDVDSDTVVSRWRVSDDPDRAAPGSELVLLSVDQPAANHNGGHLAFGPDGYLYIGLGDGGGAGDRFGNGQNGATLLGDMLRIDVDDGEPYAIPADNPFVADPAVLDEIWAIGLRNPWRYTFDRLTGDLYIADVGQNVYEEVNFQAAGSGGGENYGWPIMEGLHCFPESADCSAEGLVQPVWEYDHGQGCSVTGGYVYRGQAFRSFQGIYVVGDYCSGIIWGLARGADGAWQSAVLAQTETRLSSFGEDQAGELYVVDRAEGVLYRLVARPGE